MRGREPHGRSGSGGALASGRGLREHQNDKTAAAKALGITREGLHKKLRSFGL
jgi:transcriptional regulator of acetoin/glycerol metabolism